MKTNKLWTMILTSAMLATAAARAEEPTTESVKEIQRANPGTENDAKKPETTMMKPEMGAKMKEMEAKMKAEAEELDKLYFTMNSTTGDKKVEAISAVLNKMAQKEKVMKAMCKAMMNKDGQPAAESDASDYYTCAMHPAVRWPIPAKCPICSMDLVPLVKKTSQATPAAADKKPADPHAAHH